MDSIINKDKLKEIIAVNFDTIGLYSVEILFCIHIKVYH